MRKRQKINQLSLRNDMISNKQAPPENIGQVYSMLNRQQEAIANLLKKYSDSSTIQNGNRGQGLGLYDEYIKPRSQTIEVGSSSEIKLKLLLNKGQKPGTRQSSPSQRLYDLRISDQYSSVSARDKKSYSNKNQSISLPIIYQKGPLSKSRKKSKNKNQIMYHFKRDKSRMENRLYKIYGERNVYFESKQPRIQVSKAKLKKKKNNKDNPKQINEPISPEQYQKQKEQQQNEKMKKVQDQAIESDDQSEGEEVPTMYYQRQFRDLMRAQCLQELNFLYFSKNEKMKDWTQTLLSMIEKHDKQVTAVRKKSKYMTTFDDKFFSIGIFNTDDV